MRPSEAEIRENTTTTKSDANPDPITGAPGAHPIGVGAGAAGGGTTGALIGAMVAGPIGAGVGAVVGAVAGGLVGKGAAEVVNPTVEHEYWRGEFSRRPYIAQGASYERYAPAYQYGWESYTRHGANKRDFDAIEPELRREWESRSDHENLSWSDARAASRDAWLRRADCDTGCSLV